MHKRLALLFSLLGMVFIVAACGNNSASKSGSKNVTIVGSTALQPLVEKASNEYKTQNSKLNITVQGGGSGTGLSQVQQGSVDVGDSDIFAGQQDGIKASKIVDHKVAVVGIAPVINKDVKITNISKDDLMKIFTGKITNWKSVGGPDKKIVVINRAQGSGVRKTFEQSILGGKEAMTSQEKDSNGTVQKIVSSTPGAISYLAFSYVNKDLKALKIDGVEPNDSNVTTNKWKIWSYEHMYTQKKPSKATMDFIKYMDSKAVQNKLVKQLGYISIHDMKVELTSDLKIKPIEGR
ncbi:phosphate ABC transporter substrate-binding protein PstS family protein [Pediococcus claussenii]|uniref:Phosphate-binding protein n=1 Tax=Pediococcus claussenii (strain ATCC BAA-344 / DSM 14800 / JCM 18046 / KCTC 3811 / LMG 21948 / P06) TaxID=701521 RepID=G8PC06_PEDCP|nr:phosphate ABC transporter substrate-binding protein PstS family protein [Pediococcus claussenii]AEV94825.1 phosphate binding family protein [Pediococcus claussenii ATCC BAA-344]ANZ70022.1 phosphate ABC transporter substrate-binding protein [Pediococcus claussenii]ANZ71837.1 phosphate ABC transporter substrate-binding protein [Pediococcus claussenii]